MRAALSPPDLEAAGHRGNHRNDGIRASSELRLASSALAFLALSALRTQAAIKPPSWAVKGGASKAQVAAQEAPENLRQRPALASTYSPSLYSAQLPPAGHRARAPRTGLRGRARIHRG